MARLKPNVKKINTLDDVDMALKEIALAERELETIDGQAQKEMAVIKENALKAGEPHRTKISELSALIGAFAEYNRGELFTDKKSIELTFGVFGFRKSTSISVKKTTLDLLKKLQMFQFIRIKEEPDKDKMSDLDDEALSTVDAVRKIKDDFFCEANKEAVNADLLKSKAG